jgi:hypothetical protein
MEVAMKRILAVGFFTGLFLACQQLSLNTTEEMSSLEPLYTASSQPSTFFRTYGGKNSELGILIVKTGNQGYALFGIRKIKEDKYNYYFVKTDKYGNLQFENSFGTPSINYSAKMFRETRDSGFILSVNENKIPKILKLDKRGKVQWKNSYGSIISNEIISVAVTKNNEYVGISTENIDKITKIAVFKMNSSGDPLWIKYFSLDYRTRGHSIECTSDGGFIVTGTSQKDSETFNSLYLLKINSQGQMEWQKSWGDYYFSEGKYATQTRDGGYICVGLRSEGCGSDEICVVRVDSKGNDKWIKGYYNSSDAVGSKLYELSDGGFIISGWAYWKQMFIKIDSKGSIVWRRDVEEITTKSTFGDFAKASDGGFAIIGTAYDSSGVFKEQVSLIKTDKNFELR